MHLLLNFSKSERSSLQPTSSLMFHCSVFSWLERFCCFSSELTTQGKRVRTEFNSGYTKISAIRCSRDVERKRPRLICLLNFTEVENMIGRPRAKSALWKTSKTKCLPTRELRKIDAGPRCESVWYYIKRVGRKGKRVCIYGGTQRGDVAWCTRVTL